ISRSDTRPPMTAGPIERAFRFLNSASVSGSGDGEGVGVGEDDKGSCAEEIEIAKIERSKAQRRRIRVVIKALPSRFISVGQACRLLWGAHAPRVPISAPSPKSQRTFHRLFPTTRSRMRQHADAVS